ncbi:Uncharacterised protein [Segatella oris]|uniref:Uncharacterized protein n=1 Tax=Segatella oris TaxID=28135 RepID=A0A448L5A6_9BACT|nr:Uncharacterised protein [Segatella oris]
MQEAGKEKRLKLNSLTSGIRIKSEIIIQENRWSKVVGRFANRSFSFVSFGRTKPHNEKAPHYF